jgi:aminoglycoside 6'-N-acetyltransferase
MARQDHPFAYQFRRFDSADLAMIRQWLAMPHVAAWWGDPDEQFELVSSDLGEPAMEQFIVATGDGPFGYLQCYDISAWPTVAFGPQPDGTRAIDQFIGKPDMIDRGHGSGFIRGFVDALLRTGAPRVLTDPDPGNSRAIRAYEKAGFFRDRIVDTSDGPALLMVRNP